MNLLRSGIIALFALLAFGPSKSSADNADDLIALVKSGVDEEVVKAYIENYTAPFTLTSADIVTLKDLGLSSKLIVEALKHDQPNDSLWKIDSTTTSPESTTVASGPADISPVTAPSTDEQNISFFYSALYPYGTWINVDGNWCWQPNATVIDDDWAPYCNHGHWVWTDYGWTWASSYTWGWAPFHYGRWLHREHHGWLWLPDNEWGPAWVTWRTSPDYCGWAPLPPRGRFVRNQGFFFGTDRVNGESEFGLSFGDFSFVPIQHFYDRHPFAHAVPSSHAEEIYKRTAFERNGSSFVDNHIVNNGVLVSAVEKATKTRISRVVLTEEHIRPGEPIRAGTLSGNKLMLYKPSLSKETPQSPTAIKERFTRSPSGFGEIKTRQTLQNNHRNAAEQTAKNQHAIAQAAQREQNRLNQEAQKEANQSKQAALKGEEAVQALKVREAQNHVQRAQFWKPPQEILVPKISQPPQQAVINSEPSHVNRTMTGVPKNRQPPENARPINRPTEQFKSQVRVLTSEAQMEQQHRETKESTVRAQAQSQWQERQSVHKEEPRRKTAGSEK